MIVVQEILCLSYLILCHYSMINIPQKIPISHRWSKYGSLINFYKIFECWINTDLFDHSSIPILTFLNDQLFLEGWIMVQWSISYKIFDLFPTIKICKEIWSLSNDAQFLIQRNVVFGLRISPKTTFLKKKWFPIEDIVFVHRSGVNRRLEHGPKMILIFFNKIIFISLDHFITIKREIWLLPNDQFLIQDLSVK